MSETAKLQNETPTAPGRVLSNVIELPLLRGAPLFVPRDRGAAVRKYVDSFTPIANRLKNEPAVFRLVDLDCGAGVFAAIAGVRFPYAWIDAYHVPPPVGASDGDEARAQRRIFEDVTLAKVNAQIGTRFFTDMPKKAPRCDAIHVGLGAKPLHFDGASLADLKIAIFEWESSEQVENQTGLMRAAGLDVVHVQTIDLGRGWTLYFRTRPIGAPFVVDLTRTAAPQPNGDATA